MTHFKLLASFLLKKEVNLKEKQHFKNQPVLMDNKVLQLA